MHKALCDTLAQTVYTRSDFLYQVGLLKEFLEFVFFTEHKEKAETESMVPFLEHTGKQDKDKIILEKFSSATLAPFGKETFYDMLSECREAIEHFPALTLVTSVELRAQELDRIGAWARKEVHPKVILRIEVDPSVSVGCRLVWNDTLHDFSLAHHFRKNEQELHKSLMGITLQKENTE